MAAGMLDGDSFIFDPIDTFLTRQNDVLPIRSRKKLKDRVDEDVVADAKAFRDEFAPLAKKAGRKAAVDRQREKQEAILQETHYRAQEMSHLINAAVARHPEFVEKLKPHIGSTPDEHLEAMKDMRQRLDDNADALARAGIKVKLDPVHASAEVAKQAAEHEAAQKELVRLGTTSDASQRRLEQLRLDGYKIQTRINEQLRAAIPGNRPQEVLFGYNERHQGRSSSSDEEQQNQQQNQPGQNQQPPSAPGTPGPVASGSGASGQPGAGSTPNAPAPPATDGTGDTPPPRTP